MKTTTVRRAAAGFLAAAILAGTHHSCSAQEVQKPSPEIQRLSFLAGDWEGDASATMNGQTAHFRLRHENRVIAQGFGIQSHESADSPEIGGHYEAENLFGFDRGAGRSISSLSRTGRRPTTTKESGPMTSTSRCATKGSSTASRWSR